jgi:hypothetical protein
VERRRQRQMCIRDSRRGKQKTLFSGWENKCKRKNAADIKSRIPCAFAH